MSSVCGVVSRAPTGVADDVGRGGPPAAAVVAGGVSHHRYPRYTLPAGLQLVTPTTQRWGLLWVLVSSARGSRRRATHRAARPRGDFCAGWVGCRRLSNQQSRWVQREVGALSENHRRWPRPAPRPHKTQPVTHDDERLGCSCGYQRSSRVFLITFPASVTLRLCWERTQRRESSVVPPQSSVHMCG